MKLISMIFGVKSVSDFEIQNYGLKLAMEFGEDWLQPIQKRLSRKYEFLSESQLDVFDTICRNALKEGTSFVYTELEKVADRNQSIKESELKAFFSDYIRNKYPWISKTNETSLFDQGCYYAWKDGLMKHVK